MKQKVILQILVVLLSLHAIMYMPLQTSILTLLGAFALYGLTHELLVPIFILFMSPLIVMSVRMYKNGYDGFQAKGVEAVSERVAGMQKVTPKPFQGPSGVLEMPGLEAFADVSDVSEDNGQPRSSVPASTKDKSRLQVVPEGSVANLGSVDSNPQANPVLITGQDSASVNTALVPDATELGNAAQPASSSGMTVGPSMSP